MTVGKQFAIEGVSTPEMPFLIQFDYTHQGKKATKEVKIRKRETLFLSLKRKLTRSV